MSEIEKEILKIDSRIKYCIFEYDDGDYCVKVYFNFHFKDNKVNETGKEEFYNNSLEALLKEIREFFKKDHEYFEII